MTLNLCQVHGKQSRRQSQHDGTPFQRRELIESLDLLQSRQCRFCSVPDETFTRARRNLAESREAGDLSEIASRQFGLGMIHLWREEIGVAEAEFLGALAVAMRIGHVVLQTKCCTYLAVAHRKRGRVKDAREFATKSLSLATASQNLAYMATARANLAWVQMREDNLAEAERQACAAMELSRASPVAFGWIVVWPVLGLALAHGRLAEAVDCARAILDPAGARMPDDIAESLGKAIEEHTKGETTSARVHLQRASELGKDQGYL